MSPEPNPAECDTCVSEREDPGPSGSERDAIDARCPARGARARSVVGDCRPARRVAPRRAGRRRDQGRAARRRPVPRVQRVRGVEPVAPLGDRRPEESRRRRRVPAARGRCRRARGDVPARRDRPARHRVRRAPRAQPAPRLHVVPGVPRRAPPGATPGIRRARAGEQRPAVGAAGLAARADLLAHADAEHGRDVPRAHRHHHRADRAGGHRPRPARAHVALPGRAALHDADLVVGSRRAAPSTGRWPRRIRPACTRR